MPGPDDKFVRVFVSSTFRDMHAERDHLNRFVFPELRARCLRLGWDFLGVDLRWGITEDEAERDGALALCLSEIDRCRPFFVGLLGDRYGTLVPPTLVPADVFHRVSDECPAAERRMLHAGYEYDQTSATAVYRLRADAGGVRASDRTSLAEIWESYDRDRRLGDQRSITAAEIGYAAIDPQTRLEHCFFYIRRLRGPDHHGIPQALRRSLIEPREQLRAKELQAQVRALRDVAVREYDLTLTGIRLDPDLPGAATGGVPMLPSGALDISAVDRWSATLRDATERHGVAELSGLEALGSQIVQDLWTTIEPWTRQQTADDGRATRSSKHRHQEAFARRRTRVFVGREPMLERLFAHVQSGSGRALLVTGASGSGKSALLANFSARCRSRFPDALIATQFIGASPDSTRLEHVVAALCEQLGAPQSELTELRADPRRAKRTFLSLLRRAAAERDVIVLLDALDQLELPRATAPAAWFPFVLPKRVHLVASSTPNALTDALEQRLGSGALLQLGNLGLEDRQDLVRRHLALRHKRLPDALLQRLLDDRVRTDSRLPLYLLVAVEELCLFGRHDELGARIDSLPESLGALLEQVLSRLEHDHGRDLVASVCRWLAVAHAGLTEPEMLDVLSRFHAGFRTIEWSWLRQAMQTYLRAVDDGGETHTEGTLGFFVDQLREVVSRRYFGMELNLGPATDTYRSTHRQLASYFRHAGSPTGEHWRRDRARALAALPYHLREAGDIAAAVGVLLDSSFLEAKAEAGLAFDLLRDLSDTATVAPPTHQQTLRRIEGAIRSEIQFLTHHPQSLFQNLWNQSVRTTLHETSDSGFRTFVDTWKTRKGSDEQDFTWIRSLLPASETGATEQSTLRGHQHVVFSVAFSPDGTLVASGSRDNTIRVWDANSGSEVAVLTGHENQIQSVVFLDNERILSAAGNPEMKTSTGEMIGVADYTVRLWSIPDEAEIATSPPHGSMAHTVGLSPDRTRVVSGDSDGVLRTWSVDDWSTVRTVRAHRHGIRWLTCTSNAVLSFASDGELGIWEHGSLTRRGLHSLGMTHAHAVALSPEGTRIAVAHKFVSVIDVERGSELQRLNVAGTIGITWSADGGLLVGGMHDGSVCVWNAASGSTLRRFIGHEGPVTSVAVSPDGRRLASGSMDGAVRLWRLDGTAESRKPLGHDANVLCLHASSSELAFVSASEDKTAIVWDARTGAIRSHLKGHGHSVTCAVLTNANKTVVTGSYDDTIRFWDAMSGEEVASVAGRCLSPTGIALSPDGERLSFSTVSGLIQTVHASTRELLSTFSHSPRPSNDSSAEFEGAGLAPQGLFKRARDVFRRRRSDETPAATAQTGGAVDASRVPQWVALAYSDDGSTLAAGGLTELAVWNIGSATLRATFEPPTGFFCLAVSPRGDRVAAGGLGKIDVWDVGTRARLHSLEGHEHLVSSVAFSTDGRLLASAAEDATARIWSAATGRCVGLIQGTADIGNLVRGCRYIDRTHQTNETSFFAASSGKVAGWFPGLVANLRVLSDGVTWAGTNRTGQVHIVRVEGPAPPSTPIGSLVPMLTRHWRAGVYYHLQRGDRSQAAALLAHREEVCREFGDAVGLEECAADRRHLDPPTNIGPRKPVPDVLEQKFQQFRIAVTAKRPVDQIIATLDELVTLSRDLDNQEALHAALSLRMKFLMDSKDDVALLETVAELGNVNRALGDIAQAIDTLGVQSEVLQRLGRLNEAVQVTFEMERLGRAMTSFESLISTLRHRINLCRSGGDYVQAIDAARKIVQAAYEANNLDVAEAGLEEQAFLYINMSDSQSAMQSFELQEKVCRRLGNPERLAICLINNAVVGTRAKESSLAKAREAAALIERYDLIDLKPKIGPVLKYLAAR